MKKYEVSGALMQGILDTLGQMPYIQSAPIIQKIQQEAKEIIDGEPVEEPEQK